MAQISIGRLMAQGNMILRGMITPRKLSATGYEVDRYLANHGAGNTVIPRKKLNCYDWLAQLEDVLCVQQMGSFHAKLLANLENGRPEGGHEVIRLHDGLGNEQIR